jgi:hypothetical protein
VSQNTYRKKHRVAKCHYPKFVYRFQEPVRECFAELFRQRLPREKLSKEIRLLRDVRGLHAFHEGVRAITLDHNFAEQVFEQ